MIAVDDCPLNQTEKKGFKYLMKIVAPRYKLCGRGKIVELIEQKYLTLSNILKDELKIAEHIALTSDLWTEKHNTRSFIGLTAHYVHGDTLKSVNLGNFFSIYLLLLHNFFIHSSQNFHLLRVKLAAADLFNF